MIEAIERVLHVAGDLSLEGFEADWEKQWLVQRVRTNPHRLPKGAKHSRRRAVRLRRKGEPLLRRKSGRSERRAANHACVACSPRPRRMAGARFARVAR